MSGRVFADSGRGRALIVLATSILAATATPLRSARATDDSGAISGVVTRSTSAREPIGQVIVTAVGSALTNERSTVTDDGGRFTIDHLPAGRFALTANKPSYVTAVYGARRIGRPGIDIVLAPGQRVADLTFRLTPGASISGTVYGSNSQPLPNARITILRVGVSASVTAAV